MLVIFGVWKVLGIVYRGRCGFRVWDLLNYVIFVFVFWGSVWRMVGVEGWGEGLGII